MTIDTTKLRELAQKPPEEVLWELMQENKRLLAIEEAHNKLLNTKYDDREALPQESLYRIWHALPACNLLAAIGHALQDFSYMQHELSRLRNIEATARNLAKVKGRHNSEIAMNQLLEALI